MAHFSQKQKKIFIYDTFTRYSSSSSSPTSNPLEAWNLSYINCYCVIFVLYSDQTFVFVFNVNVFLESKKLYLLKVCYCMYSDNLRHLYLSTASVQNSRRISIFSFISERYWGRNFVLLQVWLSDNVCSCAVTVILVLSVSDGVGFWEKLADSYFIYDGVSENDPTLTDSGRFL